MRIDVVVTKHDGSPHSKFEAELLEQADNLCITQTSPGTKLQTSKGETAQALEREAVTVPSAATDRMGEAARAAQAWLAVGVNEQVGGRCTTRCSTSRPTAD